LAFIKGRVSRIAAIAHRFKGRIDLAEGGLSHADVPPPLGKGSISAMPSLPKLLAHWSGTRSWVCSFSAS
jgi:hypothetical protein